MKKNLLVITIASCFLFACSNSNDSADTKTAIPSDSLQNATPAVSGTPAPMPSTDNSGALTAPGATPSLTPSAQQQPAAATAEGMNPAHGEPGHRCDISVGAPLNSPPGPKPAAQDPNSMVTTPSISSSPVVTPVAPSAAPAPVTTTTPTTTAPGMNPPHGEPGHDCAIAVGAPLKK